MKFTDPSLIKHYAIHIGGNSFDTVGPRTGKQLHLGRVHSYSACGRRGHDPGESYSGKKDSITSL